LIAECLLRDPRDQSLDYDVFQRYLIEFHYSAL
jgi:hypothetical protein